jgi:hypothetical protein
MMVDQDRFEKDLLLPEYRQGAIRQFWGRIRSHGQGNEFVPVWPHALFWIAVPQRPGELIERYFVHLELTNYDLQPPAGCFWDPDKNARLEEKLWPRVTGPYTAGFRTDWRDKHQLYAPWDRGGLSHPEWQQTSAAVSWKNGISKIHDYLTIIHDILNSDNYHGARG